MSLILYIPPMGESGYVSDVDWDAYHFYYNSPDGMHYAFDKDEATRFLSTFDGRFVKQDV